MKGRENDLAGDAWENKKIKWETRGKRIPRGLGLINELHQSDLSGCDAAVWERMQSDVTQETA